MVVANGASDNAVAHLQRHPDLYLIADTPKGRGVFAGRDIPARTAIETCPVLVLSPEENAEHIEKTSLYHYTYNWTIVQPSGRHIKTQAVILGLGSMFNHSTSEQNVGWDRDVAKQLIVYRALRDIKAGDELCISYGSRLTFIDADTKAESDAEDGDEVLGRIQLDS